MRINFVGNFSGSATGELADETHLVRELVALGHEVQCVPRDIWKAVCDGELIQPSWLNQLPFQEATINIICKWHHFDKEEYVEKLRKTSSAPVLYWTWDFMDYEADAFHVVTAQAADLLLTNDGFNRIPAGIKWHYFPFDVADGEIREHYNVAEQLKYEATFFGSYLPQGDRIEWLTYLSKRVDLQIFSWNYKEWQSNGFTANPAVYGQDLAQAVSDSKVIVGFNVDDHTWGYWSNRTGKIMALGGCLLYRYVPGMELFLRDGADYFSTKQEMVKKVRLYGSDERLRWEKRKRAFEIGRQRFTSKERVKDLVIVIERFLQGGI